MQFYSIFTWGLTLIASCNALANSTYLTATAVVTNAQNRSAFECWQFSTPLASSSQAGTSGVATFAFTNISTAVYTILPPRYNGGVHNAPVPQ